MRQVSIIIVLFCFLIVGNVQAQEPTDQHIFTWREAVMTVAYPADWHIGAYAGNPVLSSTESALAQAELGETPDDPAVTFLFYPAAKTLTPDELIAVIFPDIETAPYSFGGIDALRAEFMNGDETHVAHAIAFMSPATRNSQIILAVSSVDDWDSFEPTLDAMLNSAHFLNDTAELDFFGSTVTFEYFDGWVQQASGQVLVAAPDTASTNTILEGNLQTAAPFVRAQLLIPSGIGIDFANPDAATEILTRFIGSAADQVEMQRFEWAEDMPAASASLEFEGSQLVLVAALQEDTALLLVGGAPLDSWADNQAFILGAMNMTQFQDIPPTPNLTPIINRQAGDDAEIFGMAVD